MYHRLYKAITAHSVLTSYHLVLVLARSGWRGERSEEMITMLYYLV